MTICDKINTIGETLQENLNERGVDCSFGGGTGESTISDMVGMVSASNFKGVDDVNLSITANRPYLLDDETTAIIVKLENGLQEPLVNKTVTVSDGVNTYTGVTDNNGICTLYVSVENDTTFSVTYQETSDSCIVEKVSYINNLTNDSHDSNSTTPNGTVIYDDIGAKISTTTYPTNPSVQQFNFRPTQNVFNVPCEFSFELLDNSDNLARLYFHNTNWNGSAIASGTLYRYNNIPTKISFIVTKNGIKRYIGSSESALTTSTDVASKIGARWGYWQNTTANITLKDFRVKEYQFADITGDTSQYIYDSRCNVSSSNGEISVTWVSGTYIFWCNKGDTSTEFDYTGDFTVEFDKTNNGNANIQIYQDGSSTYYSKSFNQIGALNPCHIKIEKKGQVFRTFIDGVEKTAQKFTSDITGACRVGFRTNSASTIKFKNMVIY